MFATVTRHFDFADTRAAASDSVLTLHGPLRCDASDAFEQLMQADHADRTLLRLVGCAAAATLVLALAASLGG